MGYSDESAAAPPPIERSLDALRRLATIWDGHYDDDVPVVEDGDWARGVSVLIQTAHAVRMGKASLALADAGMLMETVPLARLTLECAVTAAWLAVTPGSGKSGYHRADTELLTAYQSLQKMRPEPEDDAFLRGLNEEIDALDEHRSEQARVLRSRCEAVDDGNWVYPYYRALSQWSHGGLGLNAAYLVQAGQAAGATIGLGIRDPEQFGFWRFAVALQAVMVANALEAWDRISPGHPRQAELDALCAANKFALFSNLPLRG